MPAARVLLCLYGGHLVAVHGFVKKARTMLSSLQRAAAIVGRRVTIELV
ncbi:MAG: hypothetical protein ACR2NN_16500 [Bryobacteraceae bacterium]